MTSKKKVVRIPKQDRSIETKRAIMETAKMLFSEKGIHNTNSNEIAIEAGASIGSFYAYFEDKNALLRELLEDFQERFFSEIFGRENDTLFKNLTTEEILHMLIEKAFQAFDIATDFQRATYLLRYTDPDVKEIFDTSEKKEMEYIAVILDSLQNEKDDVLIRDPSVTALLIHSSIAESARRIKFLKQKHDQGSIISELVRLVYGYIKK
jgi:AcrR family transcriptional regulator